MLGLFKSLKDDVVILSHFMILCKPECILRMHPASDSFRAEIIEQRRLENNQQKTLQQTSRVFGDGIDTTNDPFAAYGYASHFIKDSRTGQHEEYNMRVMLLCELFDPQQRLRSKRDTIRYDGRPFDIHVTEYPGDLAVRGFVMLNRIGSSHHYRPAVWSKFVE